MHDTFLLELPVVIECFAKMMKASHARVHTVQQVYTLCYFEILAF